MNVSLLLLLGALIITWLEVIPFVSHVGRMKEARCLCFALLYGLCMAGGIHIENKDLLDTSPFHTLLCHLIQFPYYLKVFVREGLYLNLRLAVSIEAMLETILRQILLQAPNRNFIYFARYIYLLCVHSRVL